MKTKFFFTAAIAAAVIASVSSCEKTTTTDPDVVPAQEVAGSYTGTSVVTFVYSSTPMVYSDQTFTLSYASDNTVDITYSSDTWGEFTVTGATVSGSNPYTVSGSGTVSMGMSSDSTSEYDFTITGTVNTTTGVAEFTISVPSVMGGLTLEFTTEILVAQEVAGSYTGTVSVDFGYGSFEYEDQTVTLTYLTSDTVNISYTSDTWGEFTVTGAQVGSSNPYSISGSGTVAMSMSGDSASEYDFTVEGSVDSDTEACTLTFTIPSVMGGVTVTFTTETE